MQQHYELLFILPGTLGEDEVAPTVEKVKSTIAEEGGKDIALYDMGKSRLAYPMKHIRYGYFHVSHFSAPSGSVPKLQDRLRLMPQLLRAMINVIDPNKKMTQTKIDVLTDVYDLPMGAPAPMARGDAALAHAPVAAPIIPPKTPTEERVVTETKAEDVHLEDIDKKLDELLENDIASV